MKRILIAGVLAGLAMFVWESVAHMVLPFGEMGISTLPNEQAVQQALAAQLGGAEGLYFFPDMRAGDTPIVGPWGVLVYHPSWTFSWSVMAWEALVELAMGVALALLIGMSGAAGFGRRMALAALVGVSAAIAVSPSYTIWFGFPAAYTGGQMIVAFVDYLVGGAVIAWLLKPVASATA
jgi:pimeloyl-ACP methyl ester carboxylesterase